MKMKKTVTLIAAFILVAALSVAGTIAYLTSTTETVRNTFSVGRVVITMDEQKVTEYGEADGETRQTENEYKLIPGHEYIKDPTVHVDADSEDCYLFIKITNGISGIEADGDTTIAAQMEAHGWTPVDGQDGVYKYADVVSKGDDVVVFETFKIATDADVARYEDAEITLIACAVQADGFASAADAASAAVFE